MTLEQRARELAAFAQREPAIVSHDAILTALREVERETRNGAIEECASCHEEHASNYEAGRTISEIGTILAKNHRSYAASLRALKETT